MTLTESIVEDAALTWFRDLVPQSREVGHGPQMAAHEPASRDGGKDAFGEGVPGGRLNPAIPEEALRKVLRVGTPSLAQANRGFHRLVRAISA